MPTIHRTASATTVTATALASASSNSAAPFNARALRDAALAAHTPVKNGEGYKNAQDITARSLPSLKLAFESWGRFEASRMMAVPADDVTLRVAAYEYHSGKAMEAWLDAVPDDKILELHVVTCVSGHDNLPSATYARTNVYVAEVRGPTGVVRSADFGPGVTKQEEYSSVSPKLTIDISKPGDYVVTCAPKGSAGVGGYVEARKLVIHVTGREPTIPA
jgi:hypothetical protein